MSKMTRTSPSKTVKVRIVATFTVTDLRSGMPLGSRFDQLDARVSLRSNNKKEIARVLKDMLEAVKHEFKEQRYVSVAVTCACFQILRL